MNNNIREIKKLESSNDISYILNKTRELRKRKKITQKELEIKTGLGQNEISEIERCRKSVSFSKFLIYLKGLDIDLLSLLKNEIDNK